MRVLDENEKLFTQPLLFQTHYPRKCQLQHRVLGPEEYYFIVCYGGSGFMALIVKTKIRIRTYVMKFTNQKYFI